MVRHVLLELPSLKPPHGHHVCLHTLLLAVPFPAPPSDSPSFLVFFPLPTRPLPPHAAHPRPLPPHAVCLPGHLDLHRSTTVNRGVTAHAPCVHLLFGSLFQVAGWGHPGWGPNWKPKAAVQSVSSASSTSSTTASATGWAPCAGPTPCPQGPYFHCLSGVAANGCRPAADGPFPTVDCDVQCDTHCFQFTTSISIAITVTDAEPQPVRNLPSSSRLWHRPVHGSSSQPVPQWLLLPLPVRPRHQWVQSCRQRRPLPTAGLLSTVLDPRGTGEQSRRWLKGEQRVPCRGGAPLSFKYNCRDANAHKRVSCHSDHAHPPHYYSMKYSLN